MALNSFHLFLPCKVIGTLVRTVLQVVGKQVQQGRAVKPSKRLLVKGKEIQFGTALVWPHQPCLGRKGPPPGSSLGCASAQGTLESTPGAHGVHTSVRAAPPRPLLTPHVLKLYDFHLGVSPLAPDMERHMGVLEHPMVSLRVALIARTGPPSGVAPRSRWGVHSDSHGGGSCHSGDGLAVAGHRAAHGSGRWVPRVVRTGPAGA